MFVMGRLVHQMSSPGSSTVGSVVGKAVAAWGCMLLFSESCRQSTLHDLVGGLRHGFYGYVGF